MYGVPANLDLRPFQGDHLMQVCIGSHDLQFRFGAGGVISAWGRWELRDAAGTLLDQAVEDPAARECYRIHVLLMAVVVRYRIDPPRAFTLFFDNGTTPTVFDDSDRCESCSTEPGGVII